MLLHFLLFFCYGRLRRRNKKLFGHCFCLSNNVQRCKFNFVLIFMYSNYEQSTDLQRKTSCANLRPLCSYRQQFYDKQKFSSQSNNPNISNKMRISNYLVLNLGGKIHFGDFYLNQPLQLNYLGRREGQPNGGGTPLRNKF